MLEKLPDRPGMDDRIRVQQEGVATPAKLEHLVLSTGKTQVARHPNQANPGKVHRNHVGGVVLRVVVEDDDLNGRFVSQRLDARQTRMQVSLGIPTAYRDAK